MTLDTLYEQHECASTRYQSNPCKTYRYSLAYPDTTQESSNAKV
jgi:hypothetical protein